MTRLGLNEVRGEAFLPCLQSLPGLGELLRESIGPGGVKRVHPYPQALLHEPVFLVVVGG